MLLFKAKYSVMALKGVDQRKHIFHRMQLTANFINYMNKIKKVYFISNGMLDAFSLTRASYLCKN